MDQPTFPTASTSAESALLMNARAYLLSRAVGCAATPGAKDAWEQFYAICSADIRRMARVCKVERRDCEDLTQEVWTQVITRFPELQCDGSADGFRAWLFTLVRSRAVDLFRRKARHSIKQLSRLGGESWHPADLESDPARALERQSDLETVLGILEKLRKDVSHLNFQLVCMRWLEQNSVGEVSEKLGLSCEQIWTRQHRMLCELRRLAGPHDETP